MKSTEGFALSSSTVAALPIVNHVLSRLRFSEMLSRYLPPADERTHLDPAITLTVFLKSLVLCRNPLYSVIEWASMFRPSLLGCSSVQLSQLNDDRIGRALDRLFDADRNAMLTEFVLHMIKEFGVPLQQLHNDSTSLTLHGEYPAADGAPIRGRPTLRITFGHSKEHRPDLKQLLWILTVTEEGVPVQFKVADGNTADARTHVETWQSLCLLVGRPDFLYVADSKLCTRSTLRLIQQKGGRFITVLPRTRKEDSRFRAWLTSQTPAWQEVAQYPHPRLKDGPPDIVRALDSPFPDPDGFRLLWFHSSQKQERDAEDRREAIDRAVEELQQLKAKVEGPRSRLTTREGIAEKAEGILAHRGAQSWIRYTLDEVRQQTFRQEKRGRSGAQTRWRRTVKIRYTLSWQPLLERIAEDALRDGVFPLLTNCHDLSMKQVLEAYRRKQPLIEKRHEMLKTVLAATPMFLKNVARVEALLFLEYVALTVHALVERELRQAMQQQGVKKLALYPEERECEAPTAARVFEVFAPLQRHELSKGGKVAQVFLPEVTVLQKEILKFLGIPVTRYRQDLE
jgi:transposase